MATGITDGARADAATQALDLGGLERRLVRKGHFTAAEAPVAIAAYRQFLALKVSLGDHDARLLSPPLAVDMVWHEHILDTRGYAEACARVLDKVSAMIHHDADGDLDADIRRARVEKTRREFTRLYGAAGLSGWAWAFERAEQVARKRRRGASAPESPSVRIYVSSEDGSTTAYMVRSTAPLGKVMDSFCETRGSTREHLYFLFDGNRVQSGDTVVSLDMQDGDTINVMVNQRGC